MNPHLQKYTDILLLQSEEEEDGNSTLTSRVFVPLCGKSVDLAYLSSHPKVSHVVGIDIVRTAAEEFAAEHPELLLEEEKVESNDDCANNVEGDIAEKECSSQSTISKFNGKSLTFLIGDLFALPTEERFDVIYDRASMVAIHPSLREDYVTLMGKLLQPGGSILLVSLDRRETTTDEAKKDGPPFSINEHEIRQLYESMSWVESVTKLEEVNDLTSDADRERWEKKGVLELYEIVFLIRKKRLEAN